MADIKRYNFNNIAAELGYEAPPPPQAAPEVPTESPQVALLTSAIPN